MGAKQREKREREERRKYYPTPSVAGGIYELLDSFRYTGSSGSIRSIRGGGGGGGSNVKTFSPLISKRWAENETTQPETQKPISISPPTPSHLKPTRPTALAAHTTAPGPVGAVRKPRKPRKQPKKAAADTVTAAATVTPPGPVGAVKKPRKPRKQPKTAAAADTVTAAATVTAPGPVGAVRKPRKQPKTVADTATAAATVTVKKRRRSHLTVAEQKLEAYRRVPHDFNFKPPLSCHQLIQEKHAFDPWRVLVICILLNCTTGKQVKQVVEELFLLCTDAETTTKVDVNRIVDVIRTLGLHKRAKTIKCFSAEYLKPDWTHVTSLPGIGKYAADAYAIFCTGKGADVRPEDHKLVDYWNAIYGNDTRSDSAA